MRKGYIGKQGNCSSASVHRALLARRSTKQNIMVQSQLKNGKWGKSWSTQVFGVETPQDVIARLTRLNPGKSFRTAQ
jgi:hypothetical protein